MRERGDIPEDVPAEQILDWGEVLLRLESHRVGAATPIWVAPDMMPVVEAAAETFPKWPLEVSDLPEYQGFVVLPRSRLFVDRNGQRIGFRAFAWSMTSPKTHPGTPGGEVAFVDRGDEPLEASNGILLTLYSDRDEPLDEGLQAERLRRQMPKWVLVHFTTWAWGQVSLHADEVREGYEGPDLDLSISRFMQSLWALMKQEITVTTEGKPPRQLRRRWEREDLVIPTTKIVNLRRRHYDREPVLGEPGSVEWTHRWLVDSYWARRNTLDGVKIVRVQGHVKGPEGLPLVVKTKIERLIR